MCIYIIIYMCIMFIYIYINFIYIYSENHVTVNHIKCPCLIVFLPWFPPWHKARECSNEVSHHGSGGEDREAEDAWAEANSFQGGKKLDRDLTNGDLIGDLMGI